MGPHPNLSMVYLSTLRGLPLGLLSIIIPKASTIWVRNSSDPIGFPLNRCRNIELEQMLSVTFS